MRSLALITVIAITHSIEGGVGAAVAGPNEIKWRKAIEADLANGASSFQICSSATSSAGASEDPAFKSWAYGIARENCAGTGISGYDDPKFLNKQVNETKTSDQPIDENPALINGKRIQSCSSGLPCINQIRAAMNGWLMTPAFYELNNRQ